MRIMKPLENLQTALRTLQTAGSPSEQITAIARQLSYFLYLSYDMLVWVGTRWTNFTREIEFCFKRLIPSALSRIRRSEPPNTINYLFASGYPEFCLVSQPGSSKATVWPGKVGPFEV